MTTTTTAREVDQDRLEAFIGRVIQDVGATVSAGLVVLGDRLGLYRALAEGEALSAEELAERTGTSAAYVRPWLGNQVAGGYVEYDPATRTYSMTPEQAFVLGIPESPVYFTGGMQVALAAVRDVAAIEERFRTGDGFGWHQHDPGLFEGTERFFRPGYVANLVPTWLPALDDVVARLEQGGHVVDVGCGHGVATLIMAEAFPLATLVGIDYHEASVTIARRRAGAAGLDDRVRFEVADATGLPSDGADLVTMFDCLHDMGDPVAAARAALDVLGDDGTLMVVEPMAGDHLEENLNPIGRVFYGASTLVCTPGALDQPGGRALGAQAGPGVLTAVLREAGFGRVHVATSSPTNLVLQARR